MGDTEKLEQALDAIEQAMSLIDRDQSHNLNLAYNNLSRACCEISDEVRQEQINENVDFCATVEE